MKEKKRKVILFVDATFITETPPLRSSWAPVGTQVRIPITGQRAKRVLWAVFHIRTGTLLLHRSERWNQKVFQDLLRQVRRTWRGWAVVLFLDRGTPHTARRSRALAKALGIDLRFLPRAASHRNPVERLGRYAKGRLLANAPTQTVEASVDHVCRGFRELSPRDRLRLAGVLSERFWLRKVIMSHQLGPPT